MACAALISTPFATGVVDGDHSDGEFGHHHPSNYNIIAIKSSNIMQVVQRSLSLCCCACRCPARRLCTILYESLPLLALGRYYNRCGISGIRRQCGLLAVIGKEKCIGNAGKREGGFEAGDACKANTRWRVAKVQLGL